ncbi:MAG: aspartate carbamoyltransferase [Clostridia bacterium]|nr:aspartate carbamoyltransferase [Clostridia bacterium]
MLKDRNLIAPTDFSVDEIEELMQLADRIVEDPDRFNEAARHKVMATLFYEPSTRTQFSFQTAMNRLGGSVIGFSDPSTSSTAKGETVADTARTVSQFVDIIVVRHPKEGTAYHISNNTDCPVINAGDGGHQHPTQTMTDLLTIRHYKKRFDHLKVGVCGDLMFGRTIHSLVNTMSRYEGVEFVFISPKELRMPEYIKETCRDRNVPFTETEDLEASIPDLDILYMSRVQRERFINEEEYLRLKDFFILTRDKLDKAKDDMIVMHPLPRVNEISTDVDDDPRAVYFNQVKFGMYVRMALIMKLLGLDEDQAK